MSCISCKSDSVMVLLDLGPQPPSNRYGNRPDNDSDKQPLKFGICNSCGHMQLVEPMSIDMVKSRFDWITYNEPENHLDNVTEHLMGLRDLDKKNRIVATTYKDDTLLERLHNRKYSNLYRIHPHEDLSISSNAGLELIQDKLSDVKIDGLTNKIGDAQLLIARHVLEHAHNPVEFINTLKNLVDNEFLIFEIPDSEKFMQAGDYPFLWEEHISYFTEGSIRHFLEIQNLNIIKFLRYEYPFEDSIVVIARPKPIHNNNDITQQSNSRIEETMELACNFANNFSEVKNKIRSRLLQYKNNGKKIGLFGAGHLAVKFLNFYQLSEFIEYVIDDNKNKQGLYMPGSGLKIVDTKNLDNIDLCLLSLSPESEKKVLNKYHNFTKGGREFRSIFSSSRISILSN